MHYLVKKPNGRFLLFLDEVGDDEDKVVFPDGDFEQCMAYLDASVSTYYIGGRQALRRDMLIQLQNIEDTGRAWEKAVTYEQVKSFLSPAQHKTPRKKDSRGTTPRRQARTASPSATTPKKASSKGDILSMKEFKDAVTHEYHLIPPVTVNLVTTPVGDKYYTCDDAHGLRVSISEQEAYRLTIAHLTTVGGMVFQ